MHVTQTNTLSLFALMVASKIILLQDLATNIIENMKKTLISGGIFIIISVAVLAILTVLELISLEWAKENLLKVGAILAILVLSSLGIKLLLMLNKK